MTSTLAASSKTAGAVPRWRVSPENVIVSALKPAGGGRARIVRLFSADGKAVEAALTAGSQPAQLWLSDTSQNPLRNLTGPVSAPAWGVVTMRAEGRSD